ncbi:MAG: class I SAM-dependent methyltransferase family protein [Candidatus Bathyarchaeia archaeon]
MPKESICLKTPKINGEKIITLASKLKILNKELEIQRDSSYIYLPLTRNLSQDEMEALKKQVSSIEVLTRIFPERKKYITTYFDLLEDRLPPYLLASLPKAIDFIGDIAVIEVPPELEAYKTDIGHAIIKAHKNVRTVLAKAGAIAGTYRLREFTIIAGEPKTETIHKEHGCKYYVDLAKAYFSPRLSYEHSRVSSMVKNGETVIDMFAGVGPFSILIAKIHENVKVYAIDINPNAVALLKRNIRLNRVEGKVYPILGDAKQIVKKMFKGSANRVIMNLPENAMEFVDAACEALKPEGGIIHFYSFIKASNSLENLKLKFEEEVEKFGRKVDEILFSRFVRETAPYEWQVVLDAKIF